MSIVKILETSSFLPISSQSCDPDDFASLTSLQFVLPIPTALVLVQDALSLVLNLYQENPASECWTLWKSQRKEWLILSRRHLEKLPRGDI